MVIAEYLKGGRATTTFLVPNLNFRIGTRRGVKRIHFNLSVASVSLAREFKYLSGIEASLRLNSQLEE